MRYFAKTCTMGSEVAFCSKNIQASRMRSSKTCQDYLISPPQNPPLSYSQPQLGTFRAVWYGILSNTFQFLNNIIRISIHFLPTCISKNTNNVIRTILPKHYILSILPKALYSGEVFRVIFHVILFSG